MRTNPPNISAPGFAAGRNHFTTTRPRYQPELPGLSRNRRGDRDRGEDHHRDGEDRHDWDHDRDHDRFRDRARAFQNWYSVYPGSFSYIYPYGFGPGSYDWSTQDNQASGDNSQGPGYQPEPYGTDNQAGGEGPRQPPPWPEPAGAAPAPQAQPSIPEPRAASSAAPVEGPLTVIFKGSRAPEKMQNYMLTARALTDLDAGHYERIPIDQIDIAATARANRASGLEFQVPGASRD